MVSVMDMQSDKCNNTEKHMLSDTWVLWAHLPHNTDWSPNSYINIAEFDTLEYTIALVEYLPDSLIDNCMLFMMRKGIKPSWEDTRNRNGGCFSYKVSNRNVHQTWKVPLPEFAKCATSLLCCHEMDPTVDVIGISLHHEI